MTQKGNLFKGQQKKKASASRHGKPVPIRKGKFFKKPLKVSEELELNKELSKFINQANEAKAAAVALKEGGFLKLVEAPAAAEASSSKKSRMHSSSSRSGFGKKK